MLGWHNLVLRRIANPVSLRISGFKSQSERHFLVQKRSLCDLFLYLGSNIPQGDYKSSWRFESPSLGVFLLILLTLYYSTKVRVIGSSVVWYVLMYCYFLRTHHYKNQMRIKNVILH